MYRLEAILKFCSWWFYQTILHKMSYASLSDDFICAWKYVKYICWTYMFNMDNGHVSKHWKTIAGNVDMVSWSVWKQSYFPGNLISIWNHLWQHNMQVQEPVSSAQTVPARWSLGSVSCPPSPEPVALQWSAILC